MKVLEFAPGKYRSRHCHTCRRDPNREKIAKESDKKLQGVVQELVCACCIERKKWWWFSKLPLTARENQAVRERGGKAW